MVSESAMELSFVCSTIYKGRVGRVKSDPGRFIRGSKNSKNVKLMSFLRAFFPVNYKN